MAYALAVDAGTTGTKVAAITPDGDLVASSYIEYSCQYPQTDRIEQDADEIVRAVKAGLGHVVSQLPPSPSVLGIAVSAQRCCLLLVDAGGNLVRPMVSWQDTRATEEVADIVARCADVDFFVRTGMPLTGSLLLPKLNWVRRHEPEYFARTARIVQLHDYILAALGARDFYCDVPDAVLFGAWDTSRRQQDLSFWRAEGLDAALLPAFVEPGTVVDHIDPELAECLGLDNMTPLIVGAGDQFAGAVGAGATCPGITTVSIGTGGMAISVQDSFRCAPGGTLMTTNHIDRRYWQFEGYQSSSASVLRWFLDHLGQPERAEAERAGFSVYKLVDRLAAHAPPGANGLITLPFWAAAAAPHWNDDARGVILGLTFAHDRSAIVRSLLEGITLDMRDILQTIEKAGGGIETLRLLGGATRSEFWNQLQADIYGRPVEILNAPDAPLIGVAMLVFRSRGLFASLSEAATAMVRPSKTFVPDPRLSEVYDTLYELYICAYEALAAGSFQAISNIQRHAPRQSVAEVLHKGTGSRRSPGEYKHNKRGYNQ